MARAARTTKPPAEAITTNAVLPGLPDETATRLASETRADVVTSIGELGAFDGTELALGGVELTGAKLIGAELTGAELTGAELTGLVGAAVGMTGKIMGILMDMDMLIDMEKNRRPSSSARARKRLIQRQKEQNVRTSVYPCWADHVAHASGLHFGIGNLLVTSRLTNSWSSELGRSKSGHQTNTNDEESKRTHHFAKVVIGLGNNIVRNYQDLAGL